MDTHRFAVDVMLGRLATWLRLIGQDAAYGAHLTGGSLLRAARAEHRVLLTRDRRLANRTDVPLLFIESDHFRDQLRQVVTAYRINPFTNMLSRCARCNKPLREVPAADAAPHVPPYVVQTQERFMGCPACHRHYWGGTHQDRVRAELRALGFAEP